MESLLGKEAEVLVEKSEDGFSFGRCSEYAEVRIPGVFEKGTLVKAVPVAVENHMLAAKG